MEVNRSSLYYKPVDLAIDQEELDIRRAMDKLHQKHPYLGSRKLLVYLRKEGYVRETAQDLSLLVTKAIYQ
jgi:putative transposase